MRVIKPQKTVTCLTFYSVRTSQRTPYALIKKPSRRPQYRKMAAYYTIRTENVICGVSVLSHVVQYL